MLGKRIMPGKKDWVLEKHRGFNNMQKRDGPSSKRKRDVYKRYCYEKRIEC